MKGGCEKEDVGGSGRGGGQHLDSTKGRAPVMAAMAGKLTRDSCSPYRLCVSYCSAPS